MLNIPSRLPIALGATAQSGGAAEPTLPDLPVPIVMYGFDDAPGTNNLVISNSTGVLDTVGHLEGTGQLQLAANGGTTAPTATKTGAGVFNGNPADMGVISLLVDYGDDPEFQTATGVDKRFGRSGSYVTTAGITTASANESVVGKRWESFHVSEAANILALGSGQFDFRAQLSHVAPYCEKIKVDALVRNSAGRPTFIQTMDDARIDQIRPTDGFVSLAEQHCPPLVPHLTSFVPTAVLGDSGTRMNGADLQSLKSKGVHIGLNLTPDDQPITSYADMPAVIAAYQSQFATLVSLGLDSPDQFHVCASNGSLRSAGTKVQKSGLSLNGTATIPMADTTGVVVGMKVGGFNVPAGTVVSSVNANTSVIVNNPIPAGATLLSFTVVSGPFHTNKLAVAATTAGIKSIRQTNSGLIPTRGGIGNRAMAMPALSYSLATAASIIAQIELAILRGAALYTYGHLLDEALSSGLAMKTSEYVILLQYLFSKYMAGLIVFATPEELGQRDGYGVHYPLAA